MKNFINKLFSSLLIISLSILLLSNLHAQSQRGRGGHPPAPNEQQIERMISEMTIELSLTSSQETKITALFKDHFLKMKGTNQARSNMKDHRAEFENSIKAVLTSEQKTKFEILMKEKQQNRRQKGQQR